MHPPSTNSAQNAIRRAVFHPTAIATACFTLLALALTGSALLGRAALGPDSLLDWDPLYRVDAAPPLTPFEDLSPIAFDLPKEITFARGLHAGRVDVWNPLAGAGAPLWADEVGPFFPLKLPFYLAPSRTTYDVYLTLRLIFAALGAYFLARRRGLEPVAAIAAGASFELSGVMIAQLPYAALSAPYVLPWVILASYAIADYRAPAAAGAAALTLGIAANGGHPTMILLVFAGFAAAIAGHMLRAWRDVRGAAAIGAWALLAVILGLALAAAVLLPLAELASVGSSYKFEGIGRSIAHWKLAQSRAMMPIGLFAPGTFAYLAPKLQSPMVFGPMIGTLALVLAVAGMLGRGLDVPLLCLGLLGIVLTTAPPVLGLIYLIPGVKLVLPPYAWTLVVLVLTQAVGSGVGRVSGGENGRVGWGALALVLVGSASLLLVRNYGPGQTAYQTFLREAISGTAGLARLLLPPIFALCALALCRLVQRTAFVRWTGSLLIVLLVVERLVTMWPATHEPAARVLTMPPSPALAFLQTHLADGQARFVGAPESVGSPMTPMIFGLPDLRGLSALPVGRYVKYLQAIDNKAKPFTVQGVGATVHPLLDLAAVRYVARARLDGLKVVDRFLLTPPGPPIGDDANMPVVYEDERVIIHENRRVFPRAYVAHHTRPVADQAAANAAMRALGADAVAAASASQTRMTVLEPASDGTAPPSWPAAEETAVSSGESARIIDTGDSDRVLIDAQLDRPGIVVLADTYYPGWTAAIDGEPTPIHPANLLFRAVAVPAGSHQVEFRYRSRPLRAGILVSLLAAGLCTILLLTGRRSLARRGHAVLYERHRGATTGPMTNTTSE